MFSFIDRHLFALGLPAKDSYTIEELSFALNEYLPRWCTIGLKHLTYPAHLNHIDPSIIRMFSGKNIDAEAHRAAAEKVPVPPVVIGDILFSYRVVYELLADCQKDGVKCLDRLYKKPDPTLQGHYIWNPYRDEDVVHNLKLFFSNFEQVFDNFLLINELSRSQFKAFPEIDKIVCLYSGPKHSMDHPHFVRFNLKSVTGQIAGEKFEVSLGKERSVSVTTDYRTIIGGQEYQVPSYTTGGADFIFHENPMLTKIYDRLMEVIEDNLKD